MRRARRITAVLVFTVACGEAAVGIVDDYGTHKAMVRGQVMVPSGAGFADAIVVIRIPQDPRNGEYTFPDARSDRAGYFELGVWRVYPRNVEIRPDTVTGFVIAAGGLRDANGLLPADSVPVLLRFARRNDPLYDTAFVTLTLPVP